MAASLAPGQAQRVSVTSPGPKDGPNGSGSYFPLGPYVPFIAAIRLAA